MFISTIYKQTKKNKNNKKRLKKMSEENKETFEEFADLNLSEESVNKVIKMEEQEKHTPEKLTRAEWKAWCNGNIGTTFSAYEVEIDLSGEKDGKKRG